MKPITAFGICIISFYCGIHALDHLPKEYQPAPVVQDNSVQREADAKLDAFYDDATKQALADLAASRTKDKKRAQERIDMQPIRSKDCWTKGSLQNQLNTINEILGTPNEPEPRRE